MKRFEPILILLTDKLESINVVPVFDDVYVPDVDVMEPITFKEPYTLIAFDVSWIADAFELPIHVDILEVE